MNNNCLIIQPGAVGDCILTVPLIRMLAGIGAVDMMGHTERLAMLAGRTQMAKILSLEVPGLHQLFAEDFDASQPASAFTSLLGDYSLILTFLADDKKVFQRNLARLAPNASSLEVITVKLRPPPDWPGHAADFFIRQVRTRLPKYDFPDDHGLLKPPLLQVSEPDRLRGRALLAERNIDAAAANVIAIHPGSGGKQKCWPWENFRQVISTLQSQDLVVVVLLGPAEMDLWPRQIITAMQTETPVICNGPIGDVAAILTCCDGYLGNDSGITHLAGALNLPGVAVFGPSNPLHWRPLSPRMQIAHRADGSWPTVDDVIAELRYKMLYGKCDVIEL